MIRYFTTGSEAAIVPLSDLTSNNNAGDYRLH
jgi:hypothetical protein